MSLILNNSSHTTLNPVEDYTAEDQLDLDRLDRYLALVEINKMASRFIPDDALLALDMAGFVRGNLPGGKPGATLSTARLALALAQNCQPLPVQ